jgi:probable HAF family extracellular repeat protein
MLAGGLSLDTEARSLFLWFPDGSVVDLLPTLGDCSIADINDSRTILGNTHVDGQMAPFVWTAEAGIEYLAVPVDGQYAYATAINNAGHVIGDCLFPGFKSGEQHAAMWRDGSCIDLGTFEGGEYSDAHAINNLGQIVGYSSTNTGPWQAFGWDDQSGMQYLLGESVRSSVARDINDLGQIVGSAALSGQEFAHATIWDEGVMIDLHNLARGQSWAEAVNLRGEVVGAITFYTAGTDETTSDFFIWEEEHGMRLISDLIPEDCEWTPYMIQDIFDDGTVLCAGKRTRPDGRTERCSLLLRPVPEPGALLLICVAAGVWFGLRYR